MLLPSKLVLLIQVYIGLVNASSVFVNQLDVGADRQTAGETADVPNSITTDYGGQPIRAAIASRVLPEVGVSNKYISHDGDHQNQVILAKSLNYDPADNFQKENAIDSPADLRPYPVTISPTLILDANDKDQEELEEKIEMFINNHHQQANAVEKNTYNSRHYNTYQPAKQSALHYLSSSSAVGKYPTSPSSFSNNLNLNYIHSLLLTKPTSNSLASIFHGLSANPSSSAYYSPGGSSPPASSQQSQQHHHHHHHHHHQSQAQQLMKPSSLEQNTTLLDLSGGLPGNTMCGLQQVSGSSREPRIVGGNNSYEGEFPWAVSIQRHGNHHCGGVIVGRKWILTAAHCVRSQLVGNLLVRTGGNTLVRSPNHLSSHLERDYFVDQIVMHNDFSRYDNLTASQMKSSANTNNADIALLRLRHEIHWNELAWPVCFPPREAGNFSGHDAIVIGWGKLNEKSEEFSNELQKVKLTIIDNKVCQNWFRQAGREMPIDDRVICAGFKNGGKDACHGDSGGPLLSKINGHYAVVGVVSTGIGCARPLLPGLYSRVSSYINWIERHIT